MNPSLQALADSTLDAPSELADTQRALREISLMIDQSQTELSKLAQRNASITAHLQQVQARLEQTRPDEVRTAYDAALDAQQRLFVMRGQLDKLQSDKEHLEKYRSPLERIGAARSPAAGGAAGGSKGPVAEIEAVVNAQEGGGLPVRAAARPHSHRAAACCRSSRPVAGADCLTRGSSAL